MQDEIKTIFYVVRVSKYYVLQIPVNILNNTNNKCICIYL